MQSVPLFRDTKEFLATWIVVASLFLLSLGYEYIKFLDIKKSPVYKTEATVISTYLKTSKKGKPYQVLKLKAKDFTFYTLRWKPKQIEKNSKIQTLFYTTKLDFIGYLKGFFAPTKYVKILKSSQEDLLHKKIKNQHENLKMQELFGALFFADSYSKELRHEISKWGIAHLVAISGFHLGLLSTFLYFFLRPLYRFFQDRFFPYRNSSLDLALMVFLLLGIYIYYIDLVPSVLRAYVMGLVGFFIFSKNIKLISFSTLFMTVCLILIAFPKLTLSIAFWFSVSGVFYIFLFLHHFSHLSKINALILLNFWVYILMMPIIHSIFDIFTLYQFLSPFISIAFAVFYPLEIFLHLINQGSLLDRYILDFLEIEMRVYSLEVSLYELLFYLGVSLLAIRSRTLALLLPLIVLVMFIEYIA